VVKLSLPTFPVWPRGTLQATGCPSCSPADQPGFGIFLVLSGFLRSFLKLPSTVKLVRPLRIKKSGGFEGRPTTFWDFFVTFFPALEPLDANFVLGSRLFSRMPALVSSFFPSVACRLPMIFFSRFYFYRSLSGSLLECVARLVASMLMPLFFYFPLLFCFFARSSRTKYPTLLGTRRSNNELSFSAFLPRLSMRFFRTPFLPDRSQRTGVRFVSLIEPYLPPHALKLPIYHRSSPTWIGVNEKDPRAIPHALFRKASDLTKGLFDFPLTWKYIHPIPHTNFLHFSGRF